MCAQGGGGVGSLIAGARADSACSVSLECVADKAYPDGCMYHYREFEGLFGKTPRTDQQVLPLWTVALPCFRSPLGPSMDWRSTQKKRRSNVSHVGVAHVSEKGLEYSEELLESDQKKKITGTKGAEENFYFGILEFS